MIEMIHHAAVASIFWCIFCRARRMDADTPARVKFQNGVVLLLSLLSLPLFGLQSSGGLLGSALCVYLLIDARRWRDGVPQTVQRAGND